MAHEFEVWEDTAIDYPSDYDYLMDDMYDDLDPVFEDDYLGMPRHLVDYMEQPEFFEDIHLLEEIQLDEFGDRIEAQLIAKFQQRQIKFRYHRKNRRSNRRGDDLPEKIVANRARRKGSRIKLQQQLAA